MMKINLDCIPCFQRQSLKASRINKINQSSQERILRGVMKILMDLDWSKTPPELANRIYKYIRDETGIQDPFKRVKEESNIQALTLFPEMKKKGE